MTYSLPKGTYDILPYPSLAKEIWQSSPYWQFLETTIQEHCRLYGFLEIRTPIFEKEELFCRSVGSDSDIVMKEMFCFQDRKMRKMVLRPEGTSAIMRAFMENHLQQMRLPQKLYYIGPMFRYERPQKGRYRQHHQFGAEVIGNPYPEQDAEIIAFLFSLYQKLGLKQLSLQLNSVGDSASREHYRAALKNYLLPYKDRLSRDSQNRLELNALRILDSKDPQDSELLQNAPVLCRYLSDKSLEHHQRLCQLLQSLGIPFVENSRLVRGLDYYQHTVFEITCQSLGAQNTIGAGGRYDGLLQRLGGPDLPAIGFGTGLERILHTMVATGVLLPLIGAIKAFILPLGEQASSYAMQLLQDLRLHNIPAQADFMKKRLKEGLKAAVEAGSQYALIVGEQEMQNGTVQCKHLATQTSQDILQKDLVSFLTQGES